MPVLVASPPSPLLIPRAFNLQLIKMEGFCSVYPLRTPSRKRHGFTFMRGATDVGGESGRGFATPPPPRKDHRYRTFQSHERIPRRTAAAPAVSRAAIVPVTYGRDVPPCRAASLSVSPTCRTRGFSRKSPSPI